MLERPIRLLAIVASLFVVLGWALFALDETRAASDESRIEIAGQEASQQADPTPEQERARERAHGDTRELIDDVNDVLLAPFAPITESSDSQWVERTVTGVLALLVWGFGLGFLARFARGRA